MAFYRRLDSGLPYRCLLSSPVVISFFLAVLLALPACVEQKMTVKDARDVTVSMQDTAFTPPPRKIDDVLAVLDTPGKFDPGITSAIREKADAAPPDTNDPDTLLWFYYERGRNARAMGRFDQYLTDTRRAMDYLEQVPSERIRHQKIIASAVAAEALTGNFKKARELTDRLLSLGEFSSNYYLKAWLEFESGNYAAGEKAIANGLRRWQQDRPYVSKMSPIGAAFFRIDFDRLNAVGADMKGEYAQAEVYRREVLRKMDREIKAMDPYIYFVHWTALARNLANQGKLLEAEVELRAALTEALGHGGKNSSAVGRIIQDLGRVLMAQGRLDDAEKLIAAGGRSLRQSGIPEDSSLMGINRMLRGTVSVARGDFSAARLHFDRAETGLRENRFYYEKNLLRNPDLLIAHVKTGDADAVMPVIASTYGTFAQNLGPDDYRTAEMRGIRAMANAALNNTGAALDDFAAAVPVLLSSAAGADSDYLKKQHQKIIAEAYLDLLEDVYRGKRETEFGIDVADIGFNLVEQLAAGRVQKALGASGARSAAKDPELADLVRREQDAFKQVLALQATLTGALAAPSDQQDPEALAALRASIASLNTARLTLQEEIERRFPKYAEFTNPSPVSITDIKNHLIPGEAMITIYPAGDHTYVWAIPQSGDIAFTVADIAADQYPQLVAQLRKALDPGPKRLGDIPDFDLSTAYNLYRQLLLPVKRGWQGADHLVVAVSGPLATIPLGILPTAPARLGNASIPLFDNYREVPWLIQRASITRIPSATAMVNLRAMGSGGGDRRSFAGFGDPIFNPVQLAQAESAAAEDELITSRGMIRVRGIRVTESGDLDAGNIASAQIGMLNRLPDTSDEIRSIAVTLRADPAVDVFLGKAASEHQVKTMTLDNRRIIMFATHALIPGDLDGLTQPAIALSAPDVTGDGGDGLLTMEEVLRLRLDADWVVLSACNTGAAGGAGAEALSGLGQAFFYAGTRAMLVSMWPVETTSAKLLTTGLFSRQAGDQSLSRAGALQQSAVSLIDSGVMKDPASGQAVATYAHPLFWAPFIVVGEGTQ